jgi:hypothetical protein
VGAARPFLEVPLVLAAADALAAELGPAVKGEGGVEGARATTWSPCSSSTWAPARAAPRGKGVEALAVLGGAFDGELAVEGHHLLAGEDIDALAGHHLLAGLAIVPRASPLSPAPRSQPGPPRTFGGMALLGPHDLQRHGPGTRTPGSPSAL